MKFSLSRGTECTAAFCLKSPECHLTFSPMYHRRWCFDEASHAGPQDNGFNGIHLKDHFSLLYWLLALLQDRKGFHFLCKLWDPEGPLNCLRGINFQMGRRGPADLPGLERLLPLRSLTSLGKPKTGSQGIRALARHCFLLVRIWG